MCLFLKEQEVVFAACGSWVESVPGATVLGCSRGQAEVAGGCLAESFVAGWGAWFSVSQMAQNGSSLGNVLANCRRTFGAVIFPGTERLARAALPLAARPVEGS